MHTVDNQVFNCVTSQTHKLITKEYQKCQDFQVISFTGVKISATAYIFLQ